MRNGWGGGRELGRTGWFQVLLSLKLPLETGRGQWGGASQDRGLLESVSSRVAVTKRVV